MTVTHVGSTRQYAAGWESIFTNKKAAKTPAAAKQGDTSKSTTKASKKASPKKKSAKKKPASKGKR